ncbi:MAG: hypothetical protein AAF443_05990 [Chlamydiota bacterium]
MTLSTTFSRASTRIFPQFKPFKEKGTNMALSQLRASKIFRGYRARSYFYGIKNNFYNYEDWSERAGKIGISLLLGGLGLASGLYASEKFNFSTIKALSPHVYPEVIWVQGPSFNRKVGNNDEVSKKIIWNAPAGWAIRSYQPHLHVKYGHSGYSVYMVSGGSSFVSKSELSQKFDYQIDLAGQYEGESAQSELQAKKHVYLSMYDKIDASHQTLILDVHVEGEGLLRGGGSLNIMVQVELVKIDPFV